MKYAEQKVQGIASGTLKKLEQIAMEADCILEKHGGIDVRDNDTEDFPEIGIRAIQYMLEKAYSLGKADASRNETDPEDFFREDARVLHGLHPTYLKDPVWTAVEFSLPEGFSDKAKALMEYLDDTAFIFAYNGKLVLTDESLELAQHGDGSREHPYGGPRETFDSWDEMERWMEAEYDALKADGII